MCCADVKIDLCEKHLCCAEFQLVKGQVWTRSRLLHLMQTNLSNKLQSLKAKRVRMSQNKVYQPTFFWGGLRLEYFNTPHRVPCNGFLAALSGVMEHDRRM